MDPLTENVRRALANFVAEVMESAERRAIELVQNAFREVLRAAAVPAAARSSAAPAAKAVRDEPPPHDTRPGHGRPLPRNDVAMRARIAALIRQHPGTGTKQLAQVLNLRTDQVRRFLDAMVRDNEIRFGDMTFGGLRRRTYYVVEDLPDANTVQVVADVHCSDVAPVDLPGEAIA